jgi:hypothetical protein
VECVWYNETIVSAQVTPSRLPSHGWLDNISMPSYRLILPIAQARSVDIDNHTSSSDELSQAQRVLTFSQFDVGHRPVHLAGNASLLIRVSVFAHAYLDEEFERDAAWVDFHTESAIYSPFVKLMVRARA